MRSAASTTRRTSMWSLLGYTMQSAFLHLPEASLSTKLWLHHSKWEKRASECSPAVLSRVAVTSTCCITLVCFLLSHWFRTACVSISASASRAARISASQRRDHDGEGPRPSCAGCRGGNRTSSVRRWPIGVVSNKRSPVAMSSSLPAMSSSLPVVCWWLGQLCCNN